MDFHQLRVFLETAREKSFSRAAENIFLSQPTVSAHIKNLEKEVGTPLFDRSSRDLELTEAGEILYRYARELLNIKEEALSAIQQETRVVKGHLEIAASSVPGAYLLPDLLKSFLKEHPGVTFSLLVRDTQQVIKSIKDYTYNLGFIGESVKVEDIEPLHLMEDELILITPPGTRLCPGPPEEGEGLPALDLAQCRSLPFLLREPGSATRLAFEKAFRKRFGREERLHVVGYLESQEAIKEAVRKGLGVTVISRHAVSTELAQGSLFGYRLKDMEPGRSFYLILRKKRLLPPLAQVFLKHTQDFFSRPAGGKGAE